MRHAIHHDPYAAYLGECPCASCQPELAEPEFDEPEHDEALEWGGLDYED